MSAQHSQSSSLPTISDAQPVWSRLLVGAIFFGWLAVIWFWPVSIYTLTFDDSYYYLKTAANAGQGYGFTFDRINPTDGFHPLWMLMLVPLSLLSGGSHLNMELFVRLTLSLQLALVWAGAKILSRAVNDRKGWIVLSTAILMVNFYFTKILVNGLESAVQWFFLCVTAAVAVNLLERKVQETTLAQFFGLGLLAGLTVLSRLSAIAFAGAVLLLVLVVFWSAGRLAAGGWRLAGKILLRLIISGIGIALLVTPYLAWNYFSFGHLSSVSAAIKTSRPYTLGIVHWVAAVAWAMVWLAACIALIRSNRFERFPRGLIRAGFALLTYVVMEQEASILLRGLLMGELWYMVPQLVLVALALAFVFDRGFRSQRNYLWRILTAAGVIGLSLLAGYTWYYRLDPSSYAGYLAARHSADWLRENSASDAVAAGWDVGVAGAYSDRRLVNLDGLISSWDYKENYLDKKLLEQWLKVCKVDYIVQEFWRDQLNAEALANYHGVNLLNWKVVHDQKNLVCAWSSRGVPSQFFSLVLSRTGDDMTLADYLKLLNSPTPDKKVEGR